MTILTVPICDDCWKRLWPDRTPYRVDNTAQDFCDVCKQPTHSGIYVRRDTEKSFKAEEESRLPESACTNCGHKLDACTAVSADGMGKPNPGDMTVCICCGHIMAFADDLTLRELTDEQAKQVAGDPRILAIQAARRAVEKDRK